MERVWEVSDAFITKQNLEKAYIKNSGKEYTVCWPFDLLKHSVCVYVCVCVCVCVCVYVRMFAFISCLNISHNLYFVVDMLGATCATELGFVNTI